MAEIISENPRGEILSMSFVFINIITGKIHNGSRRRYRGNMYWPSNNTEDLGNQVSNRQIFASSEINCYSVDNIDKRWNFHHFSATSSTVPDLSNRTVYQMTLSDILVHHFLLITEPIKLEFYCPLGNHGYCLSVTVSFLCSQQHLHCSRRLHSIGMQMQE